MSRDSTRSSNRTAPSAWWTIRLTSRTASTRSCPKRATRPLLSRLTDRRTPVRFTDRCRLSQPLLLTDRSPPLLTDQPPLLLTDRPTNRPTSRPSRPPLTVRPRPRSTSTPTTPTSSLPLTRPHRYTNPPTSSRLPITRADRTDRIITILINNLIL